MAVQSREMYLLSSVPAPEVFELARALARAMAARNIADMLREVRGREHASVRNPGAAERTGLPTGCKNALKKQC